MTSRREIRPNSDPALFSCPGSATETGTEQKLFVHEQFERCWIETTIHITKDRMPKNCRAKVNRRIIILCMSGHNLANNFMLVLFNRLKPKHHFSFCTRVCLYLRFYVRDLCRPASASELASERLHSKHLPHWPKHKHGGEGHGRETSHLRATHRPPSPPSGKRLSRLSI